MQSDTADPIKVILFLENPGLTEITAMLKGHQNCVSIQSFKRYIFWVVWPLRDMDKAYRKADQSYNLRSTTTNSA